MHLILVDRFNELTEFVKENKLYKDSIQLFEKTSEEYKVSFIMFLLFQNYIFQFEFFIFDIIYQKSISKIWKFINSQILSLILKELAFGKEKSLRSL